MTSIDLGSTEPDSASVAPPAETPAPAESAASRSAHRPLQLSLVISAVRCIAIYVALPFIVPIIGAAPWTTTSLSIAACVIAIVSAAISIRRFHRSQHRMRWVYTIAAIVVITFSIGSVGFDIWLTVSGR